MFSPQVARQEVRKALSYLVHNDPRYASQLRDIATMLQSPDFKSFMANYSKLAWAFPNRLKQTGLMSQDFNPNIAYAISLSPFHFPYSSFLLSVDFGNTHSKKFEMMLIDLEGMLDLVQGIDKAMSYTPRG